MSIERSEYMSELSRIYERIECIEERLDTFGADERASDEFVLEVVLDKPFKYEGLQPDDIDIEFSVPQVVNLVKDGEISKELLRDARFVMDHINSLPLGLEKDNEVSRMWDTYGGLARVLFRINSEKKLNCGTISRELELYLLYT